MCLPWADNNALLAHCTRRKGTRSRSREKRERGMPGRRSESGTESLLLLGGWHQTTDPLRRGTKEAKDVEEEQKVGRWEML